MPSSNFDLRRRDFARTALLGAAAAALPAASRAASPDPHENLVFMHDKPGHWAGKEATHTPVATVSGNTLSVKTPHPMSEAHFIVSHSAVLDGGKYLGRAVFTPKDQPESTYTLPPGYKGGVTVTSTCNLHDFWVATITV
ncbi:MAG TPA: desulfoferrodoxin family protein [Phenylobacterium sp.]|jgi:superoxide reductase|nr:desulfoferrodoxin family protein [Phenylobacterium sp.]